MAAPRAMGPGADYAVSPRKPYAGAMRWAEPPGHRKAPSFAPENLRKHVLERGASGYGPPVPTICGHDSVERLERRAASTGTAS